MIQAKVAKMAKVGTTATSRGGSRAIAASLNLINQPGVFLIIPISELKIDTEYQRPIFNSRVDRMAEDWSWIACGILTVALRGSGSGQYFVIDGQHRMEAAIRAGIHELPCLVFESISHTEEAQGFIDVNTSRKAMSIIDRYRALLVVGDPIALKARELLNSVGRVASILPNTNDGKQIRCLEFLLRAVETDSETLERLWPLVNIICEGRSITKTILQGMFYIERFLSNTSLTERHWRRRLLQVGYDGLDKSIKETIAFEGKAGASVCAAGIIRAVNKGLRIKLQIEKPETQL